MISDHKERTAPLAGTELAIIEDENGLRCIAVEKLRGLQGPQGEPGPMGPEGPEGPEGNSGLEEDITTDFVLYYTLAK